MYIIFYKSIKNDEGTHYLIQRYNLKTGEVSDGDMYKRHGNLIKKFRKQFLPDNYI